MNPVNFTIEKFADFGTEEPWVARLFLGVPELVELTTLGKSAKDKCNKALFEACSEIGSAFEALKTLNILVSSKGSAKLTIKNQYDNLYNALWRAYKDRLPKMLKQVGFDLGFLYTQQNNFEKGLEEFKNIHTEVPLEFYKMLRNEKESWQDSLSKFRNTQIEHRKQDKSLEDKFYNPSVACLIFDNVWQAIEEIIVILVETKLDDGLVILQIPEEERMPQAPRRFKLGILEEFNAV